MRYLPIVIVLLLSGCVSIGGDCHEFTVWPALSVTKGCNPSHTFIRWERK